MGNKSSWRLKFIDIDESFTIQTADEGAVKGYMVVRAPKGTTTAKLFTRGSSDAIRAYVGLENANWPDIQEAITFNREYDLYLSCPPGSSSEYPSYIGGAYITSKGIKEFYNVSSKEEIDCTEKYEVSTDDISIIPNLDPNENESSFALKIDFEAESFEKMDQIGINYWGNDSGCPAGVYYYSFKKLSGETGTLHPQDYEDEEFTVNTSKTAGVYFKNGNKYSVILASGQWVFRSNVNDNGTEDPEDDIDNSIINNATLRSKANDISLNILKTDAYPFFDVNDLFDSGLRQALNDFKDIYISLDDSVITIDETPQNVTVLKFYSSNDNGNRTNLSYVVRNNALKLIGAEINDSTLNDFNAYLIPANDGSFNNAEINGIGRHITLTEFFNGPDGNKIFLPGSYQITGTISETITSLANGTINKKDITIVYNGLINGLLSIRDEVYGYVLQRSPTEKTTTIRFENIGYDKYVYDDTVVAFEVGQTGPEILKVGEVVPKLGKNNLFIFYRKENDNITFLSDSLYQFSENLKAAAENPDNSPAILFSVKVQKKKISQRYIVVKDYAYNDASARWEESESVKHRIIYIAGKDKAVIQTKNDTNSDNQLKEDINFNTITFSCSEEVWPGQTTSGGTFTGSLSETGKDSYGSNIYFPNILNEEDFSFIDFVPLKTFDDDIDEDTGFYKKTRIIDDILEKDAEGNLLNKTKTIKLKGQRAITKAVQDNIDKGMLGGTWNDIFETAVKQGWEEAQSSEYDDSYIFMDPTGQGVVQEMMPSVLNIHKLAIAISPKLITSADFKNIDQVVPVGRHERFAQFVGEFKVYDAYSGKYYWCNPIGDVGLACARIFEFKLGGWPPAWYNYGGVGGQLSRNIISARWKFSDNDTEVLDKKGINPIIYNTDDGLMIVSQKTLQDPNNLTDWGYLGHVMSFVLCKREIRDNVMKPQILKPIDDYWFEVRQNQLDTILARRLSGSTKIWTAAVGEVASVNNDKTKAQKKFCMRVRVKPTPFSEWVELEFTVVGQNIEL